MPHSAFDNSYPRLYAGAGSPFLEGAIVTSRLTPVLGAAVLGSLGGWLGAKIGLMTGYFSAIVGLALGLYLTRRILRNYLE